MPVSYTHLDVYKRQGVSGTSSDSGVVSYGGQTLSKAEQDGIILYSTDGYENKTADTLTAEAVSYTHLDVYKRQRKG